ncbi:MAG: hypothetical protein WCF65_00905 [Parachlamydiaceae bacterium]
MGLGEDSIREEPALGVAENSPTTGGKELIGDNVEGGIEPRLDDLIGVVGSVHEEVLKSLNMSADTRLDFILACIILL